MLESAEPVGLPQGFFQTAPYLICHEKTAARLQLSHFGNISDYACARPDLALDILRLCKISPTMADLVTKLKNYSTDEIRVELGGLLQRGFVLSFDSTREQELFADNKLLNCFVKNQPTRRRMSQVITESRIGIVDFIGAGEDLTLTLRGGGFNRVDCLPTKTGELDERFIRYHNFIIVVGSAKFSPYFAKINEVLFRQQKLWLLVTLDIFGGVVGPTFGSGGPCYNCVADHPSRGSHSNDYSSNGFDLINEEDVTVDFSDAPLARNVLPFTMIESIKVLSRLCRPMTFDGYFTFDLFNFRMKYDLAYPSPVCPVCSRA